MKKRKLILFHLAAWLTFYLVIGLSADNVDADFILKNLAGMLPAMVLFYINVLWVFPRFLDRKKYLTAYLLILVVAVLCIFIRPAFSNLFARHLNWPFDRIMFWVQMRMHVLFAGLSLGYWYTKQNFLNEKKSLKLEKEVTEARLSLLRNQMNPHFLYNTLSLIYTRALPLSEQLAGTISRLSAILRYSIAEAGADGKVPLTEEINYLQHFISLHEDRFGNPGNCKLSLPGNLDRYRIAPMLLISFIENSYKHGRHDKPIIVDLKADEKGLEFYVENEVSLGAKDISSGIGLQNVKNRLDLIYPGCHLYSIEDNGTTYKSRLTLWEAK